MRTFTQEELKVILDKHELWLNDDEGGERADLRYADLRELSLWDVAGEKTHIKSGQIETYQFAYTDEYLQIGCESHGIEEWWSFGDERIKKMEGDKALEFWIKWKPMLKQIIEMSPAEPTGWKEKDS